MATRSLVPLLALPLLACDPWTPPPAPTPVPFDDDDATDPVPGVWAPEVSQDPVRNPDVGWVASNRYEDWSDLVARAGGNEPFAQASVVFMNLSVADWVAPGDGSSPDHAAAGWVAARAQAVIDAGRYVAIRLHASTAADLPSGWPTAPLTGTQNPINDGSIELIFIDGPDGPVTVPNWADPDYRTRYAEVVASLGSALASGPGLAWVEIGGVGEDGTWELVDPEPFYESSGPTDPPIFDDNAWGGTVLLFTSMHEDAFPGVPLFVPDGALRRAGSSFANLQEGFADDGVGVRSSCMGGCTEPDPDRWPGESGTPYPADDPYGGFLAGELWQEHPVLLHGGLGSLGGWRLAGVDGSWDAGTFGPAAAYPESMLAAAFRHAPPDLFVYADDPCPSEWAGHAAPGADACAAQTATTPWPVLSDWGRQLGYRYVVTEVRADTELPGTAEFTGEIDISNVGVRAGPDRAVELGWLRGGAVVSSVVITPDEGTASWGGGEADTLEFSLSPGELGAPGSRGTFELALRVVEPRAFDGAIELPHPGRVAGWYPLVTFED